MSLYSERLATLKKELLVIKKRLGKKPFKPNQQIMYNFINGVTKSAEFTINDEKIILRKGDENKGFMHILVKHYCSGCPGEISGTDLLNIANIAEHGLKLAKEGVSNDALVAYQQFKGQKRHKLVLKPVSESNLVITMYSLT